jgi:threonine/homoserine/homoserine lactone efflux protein
MLESSALLMDLDLPLRGLAAGFIIAAPVGPVNVLCIQRTLEKGWKPGIVAGLGAAFADSLYGGIAGFSITIVIQFLIQEEFWLRLIGGMLLMVIGVVYYFKPPLSIEAGKNGGSANSDFASAFFLTLANPTTVLSFLTVLAALGLGRHRPLWETSLLIAGIFCGSMTWWLILTSGTNLLRSKITDRSIAWMNRVAGIAIGAFGLVNVVLSRGRRH